MGPFESRSRQRTAAAVAAVLCTVVFAMSVPERAVPSMPRAAAAGTLRHAQQCASVRRSSARTIVVPVVVDTGGTSDTAEVACVPVPVGSNGAQVLAARAKLLHVPAPRYAESGLLCAIDGYPATGCGVETGGHYAYWAYYHGGSSWTYASVGPASWKVSDGDVEGWRFQAEGSATPADPPPRAPSVASILCPAAPPPTTTTTVASPPTTTSPSTPVSTAPGSSGGRSDPGTSAAPATKSSGSKTAGSKSGSGVSSPTSTTRPGTAPSTTATAPATTTPRGDVIEIGPTGARTPRRLAAARQTPGQGGSHGWIFIALGVIVLLAAAAVVRTRLTKAE
ncbi:MAG TPA: hypothetical protein VIJ09_13585 [Acidimicrobiales bacterium]